MLDVPAVVPELCSKQVLTSEFIEGISLERCAELDQETRDQVSHELHHKPDKLLYCSIFFPSRWTYKYRMLSIFCVTFFLRIGVKNSKICVNQIFTISKSRNYVL
jgi:hypothetical protein